MKPLQWPTREAVRPSPWLPPEDSKTWTELWREVRGVALMTARELREAGKLWPQTLTDKELRHELEALDVDKAPISARMLREELTRRTRTCD